MQTARWSMVALALAATALAVWAFAIEPNRLVVHEERLALPRWNGAPLRLAVLSDLHVGAPHVSLSKLDAVVAATNTAHPDAVAMLGDFVIQGVLGGTQVAPEVIAEHLARLHAPLGIYAILGNHDWWLDGTRVGAALAAHQITVLENQVVRVTRPGGTFWFAGLADLTTRRVDIPTTLAQITDDAPIIAITHHPDVFVNIPPRVALTLAGHTHGGQVCLPFVGPPIVPSQFGTRYAAGHVVEGGRHLFVSTGVGTSMVPVRLGVVPSVDILTMGRSFTTAAN